MTPNVEEIRIILKDIEANPEAHRQDVWMARTPCGSAGCVAGTALERAGYEFEWDRDGIYAQTLIGGGDIFDTAQEVLGLTYLEARSLFATCNTTKDLFHILGRIENGDLR